MEEVMALDLQRRRCERRVDVVCDLLCLCYVGLASRETGVDADRDRDLVAGVLLDVTARGGGGALNENQGSLCVRLANGRDGRVNAKALSVRPCEAREEGVSNGGVREDHVAGVL
jgi:hypothetical protein